MPAPTSSPRSMTLAATGSKTVAQPLAPGPDGQHRQRAVLGGLARAHHRAVDEARRRASSIHSTPTVLACHQTCVVGERDVLHHGRDGRPVGEHRDRRPRRPRPPRPGEPATVAPEPLGLGGGAVPGTDLMARAREVARHRRAHDARAEERDLSKAQHRPDAAQRLRDRSWWRTTIARRGLLDRLLDRRLDDVVDRLARRRRRRAAAARPGSPRARGPGSSRRSAASPRAPG